jgi:hypothetical protein
VGFVFPGAVIKRIPYRGDSVLSCPAGMILAGKKHEKHLMFAPLHTRLGGIIIMHHFNGVQHMSDVAVRALVSLAVVFVCFVLVLGGKYE